MNFQTDFRCIPSYAQLHNLLFLAPAHQKESFVIDFSITKVAKNVLSGDRKTTTIQIIAKKTKKEQQVHIK